VTWEGLRFADEEYALRLERLRQALCEAGLDAAVLSDDRLTWYFTGFGSAAPMGSPARPRVLAATAAGETAFFVHRSTRATVEEMSAVASIHTYDRLGLAPADDIVEFLRRHDCRRVGLELDRQLRAGMTVADVDSLRGGLPEVADVSPVVWQLRMIKSEPELERIRAACRITDEVYREDLPRLRRGMTERDMGARLEHDMLERGAHGAWSWVVTGRGQYHRVDGVVRDRAVEEGELVFVDMGANVGGYWADFSRSAVVGRASPEQRRLQEQIADVTAIGVAELRSGRTTGEAAQVIEQAMAERGLTFSSRAGRYGHGLGLWTTEPPDIWPTDKTQMSEGMVLTVEPATWTRDGMFHCEQNVAITKHGNELLSRTDWRLVETAQ
jgi:Xaa-Pro aminopeptidase